jgi:diacylglycerol kinase family enzyme
MPRRLAVFINPTSGTGSASPDDIRDAVEHAQVEARFIPMTSGGDMRQLVADLIQAGYSTIVAAGGDGTVNAVASGVIGTEAVLGILPVGTLNHLARDLGLPLDLQRATQVLAHGAVASIDVGEVNGRISLNNSSIGLYPLMVRDRERQQRELRRPKWRAAIVATFVALRLYPMLRVSIRAEGRDFMLRTPLVFVGNNPYEFEGLRAGVRACIDRGCLCLVVTHTRRRAGLLWLALRALLGRLSQARDFDALLTTQAQVQVRRHRVHVALDGEVHRMSTPLHYRIRPAALRVLVPPVESARQEPSDANAAAPV